MQLKVSVGLAALLIVGVVACSNEQPRPTPDPSVQGAGKSSALAAKRVEIVSAPAEGDAAAVIAGELTRAKQDGRDLVVYVGATWCEPCERFHKAAEAGEIDALFPTLRLLEFDRDRDGDRLDQAGYGSRMVPLFAVPQADGRCGPMRMEGAIKGEGAVAHIGPRLQSMVARSRGTSP
jgi:thiol-disulfide isomerase/thioredoxin